MRSLFIVGLMITICIIFYSVIKALKNTKEIADVMAKMFLSSLVSLLAHLGLLATYNEKLIEFFYCLFFASVTWIVYFLYRFVILYCGKRIENQPLVKVFFITSCIDTVSLYLNMIFGHGFSICFIESKNGEAFPSYHFHWYFYVHLVLCYLPIVVVFIMLVRECILSPNLFRRKYLGYLIILGIIIGVDGIYLAAGGDMDFSVFCFAFGALASYYLSIVFVPKMLMNYTMFKMAESMKAAVFVFDIYGECVYRNASAFRIFGTDDEIQKEVIERTREWLEKSKTSRSFDNCDWQTEEMLDGKLTYLDMYYKALRDESGRFIGGFFNVEDRTEEVEKTNAELKAARFDKLTGVYNFNYFSQMAAKILKENLDDDYIFMISDVKNFKLVNDIFGEEAGDSVLRKMANELITRTDETEVYGRYDNDSFVLLMPKRKFKENVFTNIPEQVIKVDDNISYPLQIYFGVYNITDRSLPIMTMCDRAMLALKTVSGDFTERIGVFDSGMLEKMAAQQILIADMKKAVENEEFVIHLQPQVTADGDVVGAEALVRWQHPKRGLLFPGSFIEVLESNGFIVNVDMLVWELVCRQLQKWKQQGKESLYISVNISPNDFYVTDVYAILTGLVEKYQINPANLKLEITETAVMQNIDAQIKLISRLRKYGFTVEMDDFGSGYSSLNMLKEINVDVLKLDLAFLGKTNEPMRAKKIMMAIIDLAKALNMPVIAEGVETDEQARFLQEVGCNMFQGYYFAKPMDVATFETRYM